MEQHTTKILKYLVLFKNIYTVIHRILKGSIHETGIPLEVPRALQATHCSRWYSPTVQEFSIKGGNFKTNSR